MSYYTAGGFFSSIVKAVKSIGKVFTPVYKAVVKPIIGSVVKSVPVLNTASTILAQADPSNPHGLVGMMVGGRAPPPQTGGYMYPPAGGYAGRMGEMFNPYAMPGQMPMDGSMPGGYAFSRYSGAANPYNTYRYGRRSRYRTRYRRRSRRYY